MTVAPCLWPLLIVRRIVRAVRARPTLPAESGLCPPSVADLLDLHHEHRYAAPGPEFTT